LDLPVFTAIARTEGKVRTFLGAGGAAMSRSDALGQALLELGQTRAALSRYGEWGKSQISPSTSIRELEDFLDATIYYGLPENAHHLSYFELGAHVDWRSTPNAQNTSYSAMLDWLTRADLNPIVFDLNPGLPGAFITKVFIPQLTQANQPALPFLGHPRYRDVPVLLEQTTEPLTFGDLNHMPVPLP
jgi:ribosomal protein S12 methylthiotransferase accessory factor